MNTNRLIQVVAVLLLLALMVGNSLWVPRIVAQRLDKQLVAADIDASSVPPDVALMTSALGPFRGLAVNVLWYRANASKDAGKYFEANQLAQWVTKLQPRFAQVWAFNAWNMAYNISVATHTPEERWDWVNKGINLLRTQGIPLNPKTVRLYRELAWIFFHKIGQFSDDMHWFYKRKLAAEMQEIVGTPTEGATTKQAIEEFRKIVDAPQSIEQLLEKNPAFEPAYRTIRELGYVADTRLLRLIARTRILNEFLGAEANPKAMAEMLDNYDPNLDAMMKDPKYAAGFNDFIFYLRRKSLINDYRMIPERMLETMETFGPLDWRHSSAHGLYWASLGTEIAPSVLNKTNMDLLNTYRQHVHSLQELTRFGRLSFDPVTQHIDLLPDPRFIPKYEVALERARDGLLAMDDVSMDKARINTSYSAGHENFMLQAICFAYLYGDEAQARELFERARKTYGMMPHNQFPRNTYMKTLSELVLEQFSENADVMGNNKQFIDAMLVNAFSKGLSNNRADVFARFVEMARLAHKRFQDKSVANPNAVQDRMKYLDFDEVFASGFLEYIRSPSIPLPLRSRIWQNAPVQLQQRAYDPLIRTAQQQLANSNIDIAKVFPEPAGMAEFRKKHNLERIDKAAKDNPVDLPLMRR